MGNVWLKYILVNNFLRVEVIKMINQYFSQVINSGWNINAIGGRGWNLFLIQVNFGFYIKAWSTNYKPVFTELKNVIQLLRYCNFCKKFRIQTYEPKNFLGQFFRKFKKPLKIYFLLHFSSNLLQDFRICSLHYKKKCYLEF